MEVRETSDLGALRAQLAHNKAELRHCALEYLRADLEMAAVFLSVAETTSEYATAFRAIQKAWRALQCVAAFAAKLELDPSERDALGNTHRSLCLRVTHLATLAHEKAIREKARFPHKAQTPDTRLDYRD